MVDAELMRAWQIKLPTMTLAALRDLHVAFKVRDEEGLHADAEESLRDVIYGANVLRFAPAQRRVFAPAQRRVQNGPETVAELLELYPDDDAFEDAVNRLTQGLAELGEDPEDW